MPAPSGQIPPDTPGGVGAAVAALPEGVDADAHGAEEEPDDADGDPAGEEFLAEDVAGAVEGHGPEDEEGEGHDACLPGGVV